MAESIRVLQVDDDPDFADLTVDLLQREDDRFDIDTAYEREQALDKLESNTYDCVLSDYELQRTTGVELLRQLRTEYPDLPFILLTGKGSEEVASEAISAGVTDYLHKDRQMEQYTILANRIQNAVTAYEHEQRASDRHQELVETVPAAILRVDQHGEIKFANDHAESHLGFSEGETIQDIYTDDKRDVRSQDGKEIPEEDRPFQQIRESEGPVREVTHTLVASDGVRRTVEINGTPIFEDGALDSVVFAFTDITGQHRRRESLEALHDIATTIQREETIEAVSERTVGAAADILDFDTCSVTIREGEWLVPYAVSEQTPPGGARRMHIDEGLAGKTYQTGESDVIDRVTDNDVTSPTKDSYKSGISVPIGEYGVFQAVSTSPGGFDDEDVEFAELLLSHTESRIEQIEQTRELRHQNERLEEFAGIVSHDLYNPLNAAQLQLEVAREETDNSHLEAVADAHDRMEVLIEALLGLARSGEAIEDPEPVSLESLVNTCWQTLDTADATLVTESDAVFRADEDLLQTLLKNLLQNSIEHGISKDHDDDEITIRSGRLGAEGFYIEDDGSGILEESRDEVFESGYTTDEDGTGYGLKIVTEIVEAHDWALSVCESEDGGARFEFSEIDLSE